jgi:hypothetical protein
VTKAIPVGPGDLTAVQPYEHMFVLGPRSPHIPFARAEAARRAGQLDWILAHEAQISMNPEYELGVYQLIIAKDPQRLLPGSAEFAERFERASDRREVGE